MAKKTKKITPPPLPPKTAGPMIRIDREIQCLPYAGFFVMDLLPLLDPLFSVVTLVALIFCINILIYYLSDLKQPKHIFFLNQQKILLFFLNLFLILFH